MKQRLEWDLALVRQRYGEVEIGPSLDWLIILLTFLEGVARRLGEAS